MCRHASVSGWVSEPWARHVSWVVMTCSWVVGGVEERTGCVVWRVQHRRTCEHHSVPLRSLAAEAQLCASMYDLNVVKDAIPAWPRLYLGNIGNKKTPNVT